MRSFQYTWPVIWNYLPLCSWQNLFKKNSCPYSIHHRLRIDTVGLSKCKLLVSLHKRALKAILLKTTTLTISDYNFLFVLPLKERFNYNKRQVAPSLTANFSLNQSRHSGKLYIPVPRTDFFKSSRVYSGSVLWNSLPDSLRLPSSTETFKSRHMSYVMRWLVAPAC